MRTNKLISFFVSCMMCLCNVTQMANSTCYADEETVASGYNDGIRWNIDIDGTLTITGSDSTSNYYGNTPWKDYNSFITNIVVSDGLKTIGAGAFSSMKNVTSVSLPDSIESIYTKAFSGCTSLKSISIPDYITEIEEETFFDCSSLKEISLPESVVTIGDSAFSGCTSLCSIDIPDSISSIGGSAFKNCDKLSSVTLPESLLFIAYDSFSNCDALNEVIFMNPVCYIVGDKSTISNSYDSESGQNIFNGTIYGYQDSLAEEYAKKCGYSFSVIDYDNSLLASGTCVEEFDDWNYMTWKIYDDGRMIIWGNGCMDDYLRNGTPWYQYRGKIKAIEFRGFIMKIGAYAFENCTNLSSIEWGGFAPQYPSKYTYTLGDYCFKNCKALINIEIPNLVNEMGNGVFANCSSLKSVNIPSSMTEIPAYTFYGCTSLEQIEIPETVEAIWRKAFGHCSKLTSVVVPEKVADIGFGAFEQCESLQEIIFCNPDLNVIKDSRYFSNYSKYFFTTGDSISAAIQQLADENKIAHMDVLEDSTQLPESASPGAVYQIVNSTVINGTAIMSEPVMWVNQQYGWRDISTEDCYTGIVYGYTGTSIQEHADYCGFTFKDINNYFNPQEPPSEIVTEPDVPLEINTTEITISVGNQYFIEANQSDLTYQSSDVSVAVVSNIGRIIALKEGVATITVTNSKNENVMVQVTVIAADDSKVAGDVDADGSFTVSDIILMQKWLLAVPNTNLANWQAADLYENEKLDVFDLCLMKRKLIYG